MQDSKSHAKHTDSPAQAGQPKKKPPIANLLDDPLLEVFDDQFAPNPFEVWENESADIIWKGTGSSATIYTTNMEDPPIATPIFGGTTGQYTITSSGDNFPVSGSEGDYYVWLGQIGGGVRGNVTVKKRTA